ncbi:MAG: hypothetical protein LiPW15_698 [Parcubacteria group bacterium LiPW_15]|nr:MAG: hypothetical protein LiPW15_698 [Parcubacteria group bacterium LiPW_15]
MNVKEFREALEQFLKNIPYSNGEKYRQAWNAINAAAAPEHVPTMTSDGMNDQMECSCGWKSRGYWDGADYAEKEWRDHVADDMGILPRKCPCGKEYLPADGGQACHKLLPIEK